MSGSRARCRSLFRWRYGSRGRALGSGAGSRWGPWLPFLSLSVPAGARARPRQLPASLTSRRRTAAATRGSARRRPPLSRQPPAIKRRARMTASSSATATRPVPSPHLTSPGVRPEVPLPVPGRNAHPGVRFAARRPAPHVAAHRPEAAPTHPSLGPRQQQPPSGRGGGPAAPAPRQQRHGGACRAAGPIDPLSARPPRLAASVSSQRIGPRLLSPRRRLPRRDDATGVAGSATSTR